MTQENRFVFLFLFALSFLCISAFAEFSKSPILSNNMKSVISDSGILFIETSHGVNYTQDISADTVKWFGDKSLLLNDMFYQNGNAILLAPGETNYIDKIIFFNPFNNESKFETLPFNFSNFNNNGDDFNKDFYFRIDDIIWRDSSYWFACFDGGVVKYNSETNVKVYLPQDTESYFPSALNTAIIPTPDPMKRVVSLSPAGSNKYWVGTLNNLLLFDYSNDSIVSWDSIGFFNDTILLGLDTGDAGIDIPATDPDLKSINKVLADPTDSNVVIVFADYKLDGEGNFSGSAAYLYNRVNNSWKKIGTDRYYSIIQGSRNDVFLSSFSARDKIYRYEKIGSQFNLAQDGDSFKDRLNSSIGAPLGYQVTDISFSKKDSLDILVIVTTKGLFYSLTEYDDEKVDKPFVYIKRSVPLKKGLEQTYSYPSIITGDAVYGKDKAYFAYNLSKDSKVSIDIYDYNMDHVVRIIDEASRNAGSNNSSGRSTVEAQDYWDGTAQNDGGKSVPPGVYYYKIKTDKGEKAFGKVIVAKN